MGFIKSIESSLEGKWPLIFFALIIWVMLVFALIAGDSLQVKADSKKTTAVAQPGIDLAKLQEKVFPASGYKFNVKWGD